jgi:hypothetical protein
MVLKHVLDFGGPFISPNGTYIGEHPPLILLARESGLQSCSTLHIIDKAILLLNRKADISHCGVNGNTVLHSVLIWKPLHQLRTYRKAKSLGIGARWMLSLTHPLDLLMVFITAGADVYATNLHGYTPSRIANACRRTEEWIKALELCGFNSREVLAHSTPCTHDCRNTHQTSKLQFEEYCQQREPFPFDGLDFYESDKPINTDSEDGEDDENDGWSHEELSTECRKDDIGVMPGTTHSDDGYSDTYHGVEFSTNGMTLL